MFSIKAKGYQGFSLAEVLLTLTIIGIISTLIIPSVINSTNDLQHRNALKRVYGELAQASVRIIQAKSSFKGLCDDSDPALANECIKAEFSKYFNVQRTCSTEDFLNFNNGCWLAFTPDSFAAYASEGGQGSLDPPPSDPAGFITSNGISIGFEYVDSDCQDSSEGIPACGKIRIDVNGLKSPNADARDKFYFHIRNNGILPFGSDDLKDCGCGSTDGCTLAYLQNSETLAAGQACEN